MAEKITAVYVMVRQSELTPEDGGRYDRPLALQKEACLQLVKEKGFEGSESVRVYTSRSQLLKDIERDEVARLVIENVDRLGITPEEIDAILHEMKERQVDILQVSA